MTNGEFAMIGPRVLSVRADSGPFDVEEHIQWYGTFSRDDEGKASRVLIATLHAASSELRAEVTIGVQIRWIGEDRNWDDAEFLALVAESDALESAYDVARGAFMPIVATVANKMPEIPFKSPDAEISFVEDLDDDENSPIEDHKAKE
ncbi:hypothetical protein [Curtobacterium oceanosedimentum]|uniref:hypothetical protein n=1 Tax=Curtobacterium oceanosedimentum TaxID=465820 RepID=UPI0033998D61